LIAVIVEIDVAYFTFSADPLEDEPVCLSLRELFKEVRKILLDEPES
jgi:hypothetical protein